jgi:thiol-disulfide isomerase/thioredoxin
MMKTNTAAWSIVTLFLITIIPFGSFTETQKKTFAFDKNTAEGYVAFVVNESTANKEDTTEKKCECRGKKVIVHGDGHKTPCPCLNNGSSCNCKPDDSKNDDTGLPSAEKRKFILVFTASWCGPCEAFKKNELPKLKEAGLTHSLIMDGVGTDIEMVDIDRYSDYYELWKKNTACIPFYVLINTDGVEFVRREGYQTKDQIMEIWNANK